MATKQTTPAAPDPQEPPAAATPALRISALQDGFRRAGVAHSTAAVDHPAGRFTLDEVIALENEPKLVVVRI